MTSLSRFTTNQQRVLALGAASFLIVGSIALLDDSWRRGPSHESEIASSGMGDALKMNLFPRVRELVNPAGFINTDDTFTLADHVGKRVILVDFWTYSCINCQRTQPYLNAWQEKYGDQGLLIVGVHTPEFEFEEKLENVQRAVADAKITYPVVLDNKYETWRAYQNRYWPRKYLIDIDGYIVYDHIGEGGYAETEKKIQELLQERAERLQESVTFETETVKPQAEANDRERPRTHEVYFGAARNIPSIGNARGGASFTNDFAIPTTLKQDRFHLGGTWAITEEYIEGDAGARVVLPYRAQKVFLVASSEKGAKVEVLIDGKRVTGEMGGAAVRDGVVTISANQLYRLIESPLWGEHTLELRVIEGSVRLFSFTFG